MSPPDFRAEAEATALLLSQRLYSLRIDPLRLVHERPIRFDTFENYCALTRMTVGELKVGGLDGLTLRFTRGGEVACVVLYPGEMEGRPRLRFTIAHELGHIYLAHKRDNAAEEREANRFAAALLIPRILAAAMLERSGGFLAAAELAAAFGTSRAVAELRLRSLRARRPEPSADERALLEKLGGFLPDPRGPVVTV